MKINYLFKNIGRVSLVTGLLTTTFLSSCLKDKSPGTIDFGKSPALISFQYSGFAAAPITTKMLQLPAQVVNLEVTLSVASVTLSSPVTATLVRDDAGETAYIAADTAGGRIDHKLPASQFSIPNGGKVTINPGQQIVEIPITYAADVIDFTQNYVLGWKLANPSGAQLTTNLNNAILRVTLKSPYEATYSSKGFFTRLIAGGSGLINDPALGGPYSGISISLATITTDQVAFSPTFANGGGVAGIDGTSITVDPATHKVTMAASGNPALHNAPGYDNRYDPATKTFYLSFTWSATRADVDTLTYTGP